MRRSRTLTRVTAPLLAGLLLALVTAADAFAQAWVPPAGVGIVTVALQDIDNTGHRLEDGSFLPGYESRSRSVLLYLDYAFTDRLSISAGLPYVASRYRGVEPSFSGMPIDECRCWNHGWQDFGLTARYNLSNAAFALTPSISVGLPSHDYEFFGEAVLGRNLKEVQLSIDAGQRLDAISPRLSLSGRYSYAIVEKVIDVSNHRSMAAVEVGVLATRRFATRATFSWQRSHGGLRSPDFETDEQFLQYDRLLRDSSFHIGGGAAYSLRRVDFFAAYTHYVRGTDTHTGRAFTTGISWPFQLR